MTIEGLAGDGLTEFVLRARPVLERALVARYGIPVGLDAAADAAEYAHRHWERLSKMDNPTGYLFRVGVTSATRSGRGARRIAELVAEPTTADVPVDIDLQRALLRLSWEQRVAVVLVHAHGHTYAAAAELMDLPITSVTNHISRGLKRLRRLLENT